MKKTKISKVIALITIIALIMVSFSTITLAARSSDIEITPFWDNTNSIIFTLAFDNGVAEASVSMSCISGVNKIEATIILERKMSGGKYEIVDSWSKSSTKNYLDFVGTANVKNSATYRVRIVADVYNKNGVSETVEGSYERTYY